MTVQEGRDGRESESEASVTPPDVFETCRQGISRMPENEEQRQKEVCG